MNKVEKATKNNNILKVSSKTTTKDAHAVELKPKKKDRSPLKTQRDGKSRDNGNVDADGTTADHPVKRKRIGAGEMKRMAKELSVAEEEDDIFNSGFFDNLNASSQSFYDLSTSHFAANDSLFEDIDFANDGLDDSILNKSTASAGAKKVKSGDWKASYVNKLSRKVKTISLTRDDGNDDQGDEDEREASFRDKSNGKTKSYASSSSSLGMGGKGGKKRKTKKHEDQDNEDDEEEDEREGSRLDEEVWEFKKGSMRVSSDMPYEGDLSGDEDGDF